MHVHVCWIELFRFLDLPTCFVETKFLQEAIRRHEALLGSLFR